MSFQGLAILRRRGVHAALVLQSDSRIVMREIVPAGDSQRAPGMYDRISPVTGLLVRVDQKRSQHKYSSDR